MIDTSSAPGPGVLRAEGLVVDLGTARIELDELTVHRGECLALLGANGAGKTTLLRTLGLLRAPDEGRLWVMGEEATAQTRDLLRTRVASLLQDHALFRGTVRDNVGYRVSDPDDVAVALDLMGITDLADRDVRTLSGGQARRVAIAQVLARAPEILFLDEPTDGLDESARTALLGDLGRLKRRLGLTIVLVTHRRLEAVALGDRIGVMRDGRLVQVDRTEAVLAHPVDPDAADFLGFENLWRGVVVESEGGLVTVRIGPSACVQGVGDVPVGREVIAGVKSEDVVIKLGGDDGVSRRNHLVGRIDEVEPRWSLVGLRLRILEGREDSPTELHAFVTRRSAQDLELEEGRVVVAGFKAMHVRVWETGGESGAAAEALAAADALASADAVGAAHGTPERCAGREERLRDEPSAE